MVDSFNSLLQRLTCIAVSAYEVAQIVIDLLDLNAGDIEDESRIRID